MEQPIVKVEKLTKRFRVRGGLPIGFTCGNAHWLISSLLKLTRGEKVFTAVNQISFQVQKGEFIGLIGPNGAGKTTLLKCLATLLTPDEGTAFINGYDVRSNPDEVKLNINLIGSGHWIGFDWGLTVKENLEFFGNLYGLEKSTLRERIEQVLQQVGLQEKAKETPNKLSTGQRQRMLLAKGFLIQTPVFLLDEPTVGLDPVSAREIRQYIKEQLSEKLGVTILLTTHHMQEVEELCSRIFILHQGRIINCGTPQSLKQSVQKEDIVEIQIVGMPPNLCEELQRVDGVRGVSQQPSPQDHLVNSLRLLLSKGEGTKKVMKFLSQKNIQVQSFENVEPSLEDVFLVLTGKGLFYEHRN